MTAPTLQSYLGGKWLTGSGRTSTLHNPTTGEVVAQACTEGLQFAAALAFARDIGGPALRAMTFAERGAMLMTMSKAIHAHRDELLAMATLTCGNTRGDAKFDVDGATSTLAYYSKLGAKLGEARWIVDGDSKQLAANPRYIGQHIKVARRGVAVHINAFNFPAWGFGEKAAVALLAGMPIVVKPATSTAVLTERMFRILVDAGVCPEGVISLVAGSPGDLVDHLGPQDVLAFTGSADTGAWIRSRPAIVEAGVRVNVEADSLNAAVLGPDVERESPCYDLFIRECARDMTQKAGQKCTAIRRIFVPAERVDEVGEDLTEEIKRTRVGDPSASGVRMGPLATQQQYDDVRAGIQKLAEVATFVYGDGGRGELVGVPAEDGYFVGPTLLRAPGIDDAPIVHELEVFGPVQTLIPYSGEASEAVRGVAMGQGGLVSSVYSDDRKFVADMLFGLAPFHGRLHFGHSKVAEHSPGPGTVMPQMVHGGPGRAGGGEELGGLRGLDFYFQRCAVQGLKPLIEKTLA
jgi:oxepin-CoA hydrolase/3-oxo-5,6-dehydrosuberyl-CoA semialdehyde dehydrogenase